MRRIAIVAPASVTGVSGGAENLWAGLVSSLNQTEDAQAELLTFATPEQTLAEVLAGYERFARCDVAGYDQVITTKYPAWAVYHPHHTVYLQHTLRGLYDTYPTTCGFLLSELMVNQLKDAGLDAKLIQALCLSSAPFWRAETRARAVTLSLSVTESVADLAKILFEVVLLSPFFGEFPGPFARACVRLLDALSLRQCRIKNFFSISETVAQRKDYFPIGTYVEVIHHPSAIEFPVADTSVHRDVIVTASRLESPKRIDLLINAYRESGVRLPFWIVGDGPDRQRIEELARGVPGIHLKGRLSEAELVAAYRRALFVPFAPFQEDYGLITVEAFSGGAAVLTTTDSGGPTELVRHQETGLICPPTVQAMARGFLEMCGDPVRTASWGQRAQARAAEIRWPSLSRRLIGGVNFRQRRLLVLNTFPIEPTNSGGKLRMKGLYKALSRYHTIHMISLGDAGDYHQLKTHQFSDGLVFNEEVVTATPEFEHRTKQLSKKLAVSSRDLAVSLYGPTLNQFSEAVRRALVNSDIVICAHPYAFGIYEHVATQYPNLSRPIVYEAHNVESDLKPPMYGDISWAAHAVRDLESRVLKSSLLTVTCSEHDAKRLQALALAGRFELEMPIVCPNGLAITPEMAVSFKCRAQIRDQLGLSVALFMGSDHGPNQHAIDRIVEAARDSEISRQWRFVVLGSIAHYWARRVPKEKLPESVLLRGEVSEEEKNLWLSQATVGLNPIESGSGTNLKLAEYAAWALPILSTTFGSRGGFWESGQHYVTADDGLVLALNRVRLMSEQELEGLADRASRLVRERLTWDRIVRPLAAKIGDQSP